jgi:drug/metabolite transporter (DMT)-like permease
VSTPTLLVWILTCLIWSTVWLFIKIGVGDVPPVTFAAWRLAIAMLVLVPLTIWQRIPLPARAAEWRLITGTGVMLLGVNYALLNWGIQFISSGLTAVLQATTPVFALVFSHMMLPDDRMSVRKVSALLVGVAGTALVFWNQLELAGPSALQGCAAVVGGSMFVALAYVVMKRRGTHLHPSAITSGQMAAAFVPLVLYASVAEGNPIAVDWSQRALVSVTYLALVGSIGGAWLNYWLLKRTSATNLLLMGLVEPLIAVALGAWWLNESMSSTTIVGGVAILISVGIVLDFRSHRPGGRNGGNGGVRSRIVRNGGVRPRVARIQAVRHDL